MSDPFKRNGIPEKKNKNKRSSDAGLYIDPSGPSVGDDVLSSNPPISDLIKERKKEFMVPDNINYSPVYPFGNVRDGKRIDIIPDIMDEDRLHYTDDKESSKDE